MCLHCSTTIPDICRLDVYRLVVCWGLYISRFRQSIMTWEDPKISKLHSDGAKEYVYLRNDFGGSRSSKSFSPPHNLELNAIVERINGTIVADVLALLIQAKFPLCVCPSSLKHVIYVRDRIQHSTVRDSPYLPLTGSRPSWNNVRVFGCTACVLRLPRWTTVESRSREVLHLETVDHGVFLCFSQGRGRRASVDEVKSCFFWQI